jgi:hypothetical protein
MSEEIQDDGVLDLQFPDPNAEMQEESQEVPVEADAAVEEVQPEASAIPEPVKEAVKEEIKSTMKTLKIKVDGKEIDKMIDVANDAELIKMIQMAEMAQKRAQEAADLRKSSSVQQQQVNAFLEALKNTPEAVLADLGINVDDFAEKHLSKKVEELQMSPEQKRIQALEQELKAIQAEKDKAKKEAEEKETESLKNKYAADFEKDLMEALQGGKLPDNAIVRNQMVGMMRTAFENGIDMSFKELIPLVQDNYGQQLRNHVQGLTADDLVQLLNDESKKALAVKLMPAPKPVVKKAPPVLSEIDGIGNAPKDESQKSSKKVSSREFFKNLGTKYSK